jgi:prophage regulatory protein
MNFELWRKPKVKAVLGYKSDTSPSNDIRNGILTTGVAIGQRSKAWPSYEVLAIAEAKVAGKTNDQIRELVKSLHAKRHEMSLV